MNRLQPLARLLATALTTVTVATAARAQTCLGHPSFAVGTLRMSVHASSTDQLKGLGASFAFGESTGLFGGPSFEYQSYPAPDDKALIYVGHVGWSFDVTDRGGVGFCPLFVGTLQEGPTGVTTGPRTTESSANNFGLGASIGGTIPLTPRIHVVPFLTAVYTSWSSKYTIHDVVEITSSTSASYLALTVGAGVIIDRNWAVRPSIAIPVGLTGGKTTLSLAVSLTPSG